MAWWRILGLGPRRLTFADLYNEITQVRHAERAAGDQADPDLLAELLHLINRLLANQGSAPAVLRDYLALLPDVRPAVLVEKDHTGYWQVVTDMPVIDVGRHPGV